MSSLLPSNASALERIAAQVGASATDLPVPLRTLWNPYTCRLDLLPWLAWAWSVDDWSDAWSERQKRGMVAQALAVQRIKGTIGAVRRALGAIGLPVRVQEWFNQTPPGQPYTFRLLLEVGQVRMTPDDLARVFEIVANTKNLRSHLETVLITVVIQGAAKYGTTSRMGSEITVSHYQPPLQPREAIHV